MDRKDLVETVQQIVNATTDEVLCVYLFGSVARGEATDASDIDLAILLRQPPEGRLTDLRFSLEGAVERATRRRTQVVVLNDAPPDLVHRVLLDGLLLLDRDSSARILFEVQARNAYFDLLPTLQLYRRTSSSTQ